MCAEWVRTNRDSDALLYGARLTEAQRWLAARVDELTAEERDYIAKGAEAKARRASLFGSFGLKKIQKRFAKANDEIEKLQRELADLEKTRKERLKQIAQLDDEVREMTPSIFISYAREDYDQAYELYGVLRSAGFKPWMDKVDLVGGEPWKAAIRRAIKACDFILLCLSSKSIYKKGFVQAEMKYAWEEYENAPHMQIRIVPVRLELLDNSNLPDWLSALHMIDSFDTNGQERLVEDLWKAWKRKMERQ